MTAGPGGYSVAAGSPPAAEVMVTAWAPAGETATRVSAITHATVQYAG